MAFDWRSAEDAVLEAHFNPRAAVGGEAVERWIGEYLAASAAAREAWPGSYGIAYGARPREALDLQPAGLGRKRGAVHVHPWRLLAPVLQGGTTASPSAASSSAAPRSPMSITTSARM